MIQGNGIQLDPRYFHLDSKIPDMKPEKKKKRLMGKAILGMR